MGQVYLAEQISLKRKVALKVLRPDLARSETSLARFKAEAEAVARATHANIVQVYYVGEVDGLPFMALEYVEGRNLREYLARKGPLELAAALSVMRQVAAALDRAGELGIIHRDIKPDNILLTRKGEVKVADFGLSRVQTDDGLRLTQSGVTMGTPLYMSPEQAEGKPVDSRSDIYSFGVTCYHMLAGEPPFRGATAVEVAVQHVTGRASPLSDVRPDLPPALCAVVHRMMARNPEDRFQTARELLREIVKLREGVSGAVALAVSGATPSVEVERVGASAGGSSVELHPAKATAGVPGPVARPATLPRWLTVVLFAASLGLAALAGVGLARARRPAALPPSPGAPGAVADAEAAPLEDEAALRRTADIYLAAGQGKDVSVGMSLCVRLANLYLDEHRLDDADKLFTRLDNIKEVRAYHTFGRIGRAVVLALQDRAQESNQLFREVTFWLFVREVVAPKGARGPDPDLMKTWQNPSFLFWLAQAVRYNHINGVPDDKVAPPLRRFLDLKPKP
jgi:serine/threonine-protein kinase